MPDFPSALIPVGRTFTAGVFPHTALRLLSGRESRIRHSSTVVGHSLRVSFTMLTTAEMISIREHYADQLGGFLPFNIPDDLLSGVDTPADFTPSGHRWLYDGSPKVTDVPIEDAAPLNRHNVELAIKTIPPANAIAGGARWRARVTWRPGPIITAGLPLQLTATATWSPGLPSARSTGATLTATATWAPGKPSHIPGLRATATATWAPGGAGDQDVVNYIAAVEAADGQALETGVKDAIRSFISGVKADGNWTALKAACILAGARTLSGALVPLVGSAPTNNNFVSGDYNRKTGLIGNGSTKYLNTNRNHNTDPQNNYHMAIYVTTAHSGSLATYIGAGSVSTTGGGRIGSENNGTNISLQNRHDGQTVASAASSTTGFMGTSRSASGSYDYRVAGTTTTSSTTSQTPWSQNVWVYANGSNPQSNGRLSWYSIGEAVTLSTLDSRLVTLMNALAAAIP